MLGRAFVVMLGVGQSTHGRQKNNLDGRYDVRNSLFPPSTAAITRGKFSGKSEKNPVLSSFRPLCCFFLFLADVKTFCFEGGGKGSGEMSFSSLISTLYKLSARQAKGVGKV